MRISRTGVSLGALSILIVTGLLGATTTDNPGATANSKVHPVLLERLDAQDGPVKAWVFFADKGVDTPAELDAALADVAATYDSRAVQRRRLRGDHAARGAALFDIHDLPVVEAYVAGVKATGATVHVTSRWLNAVSVYATRAQVEALAALPFVDRLEAVRRSAGLRPMNVQELGAGPFPAAGDVRALNYGNATEQLTQINVIALHNAGYTGQGVIVGILDTGFRRTHTAFNNAGHPLTVLAEYDFVDNDGNAGMETGDPSDQHTHGTMILGCIGAYLPGSLVGGAYDASFVLAKTEDTTGEYPAEEDNYVAGLEFLEAHGVDMTTSSLGYIDWYTQADLDGQTAVTTIAINISTGLGIHHCNAAGNEYHDASPTTSSLIAPADGFQVITCGAVTSTGSIASFSSDGPTADGRVKPEVLARGVTTHTVSPSYDTSYTTADGTSLSTPLVACAVACLIQAHPDWTVDQMRNMLFQTADYYVEHGTHDPQYVRGYGIIDAYGAALDCNNNAVPDGAELSAATDCQGNGVLDECELAAGTSADCNGNSVPDECDLMVPAPALVDDRPAVLGWVEISSTGTAMALDDDWIVPVTMPFTSALFPDARAWVANDGALGFGGAGTLTYLNETIPTPNAFGGGQALFPLWDDIDSDTGNVYRATIGAAPNRTFIVEWYQRPHFRGDTTLDGDEATFQVQVFETPVGAVYAQMLYLDTDFLDPAFNDGAAASVGYQTSGASGLQWSYNQAGVGPSTVLSLWAPGEPNSYDANGNGVPDECESIIGDVNCDGAVTFADINPFVMVLVNPDGYAAAYPDCDPLRADCNGDDAVDFGDINAFVDIVTGPGQ